MRYGSGSEKMNRYDIRNQLILNSLNNFEFLFGGIFHNWSINR
jgi:hypothetical protein